MSFLEYVVWQELSENLTSLASLSRSESFFPSLQRMLKQLYQSHYKRLGWDAKEGESSRIGTIRATIIGMMGLAGDDEVNEIAYKKFLAYKANPALSSLHGDLKGIVFRCALRHDEATVYAALKDLYENSNALPEEKRECLVVMSRVKDMSRHSEILKYIFFSDKVRLQDMLFPLGSLSSSSDEGGQATWKFFCDNYTRLRSRFGNSIMWGSCVGLCCRGLQTFEDAQAVERFFDERTSHHSIGSAKRRLEQALEIVKTRAARRQRDRDALADYLSKY
jgi:aminopeptidase N